MRYTNPLTRNANAQVRGKRTARWPLLVVGCLVSMGCAAPETTVADGKPDRCRGGQYLSCDVEGYGGRKTYSNCRCEHPRDINRSFSNYD